MSMSTASKELVAEGFRHLNGKRLEAFFALYDQDLHNPTMANLGLPTDKSGFERFVASFYRSFSEPKFRPEAVLCDGDTAMFRWVFEGKHTGEFNGVAATGRPVRVDCFTAFKVGPRGTIIQQHDVGDLLGLMRQIS